MITGLVVKIAGRGATHIALSDGMAKDIERFYGVAALTVHNAGLIDFGSFFDLDLDAESRVLHVGFLANITLEKGVTDLIEIFRGLRVNGVDAVLHVAGPINDEASRVAIDAAASEFEGRFVYHGRVNSEEKKAFFRKLHVFVFPSRYKHEAQPLVLLEAMSFGVPAFTSDVGYAKELVPSPEYYGSGVEGLSSRIFALCNEWQRVPTSYAQARRLAYDTACSLRDGSLTQLDRLIGSLSSRV